MALVLIGYRDRGGARLGARGARLGIRIRQRQSLSGRKGGQQEGSGDEQETRGALLGSLRRYGSAANQQWALDGLIDRGDSSADRLARRFGRRSLTSMLEIVLRRFQGAFESRGLFLLEKYWGLRQETGNN